MKKKVTLYSIANACNTSIGTVSRALNGKSDIKPETRDEILHVAKELGYFRQRSQCIKHNIGVVFSKENAEFYSDVIRGIQDAKELILPKNMDVVLLQTNYLTVEEQIPLLASVNPNDFDALIINSAGPETNSYIDNFISAGVAISTFNTDASNSRRLFFIGADSFHAGQLGGELLAKLMSGDGCVAVFGNFTGDSSWMSRFNGFCSVLQRDYPEIELIPVLQRFNDEETSCHEIMVLLENNPKITALFPASLSCTRGAIRALSKLNRHDLKVVGFDTVSEIVDGLKNGYCDALLYQNPYLQGFQSVRLMARYLEDHHIPTTSQTIIPSTIILKNNVDELLMANKALIYD